MEPPNQPFIHRSSSNVENLASSAGGNQIPMASVGSVVKDSSVAVNDLTQGMGDLALENENMSRDWKQEMSDLDKMFLEHAREKLTNLHPHEMPTDLLRGLTLLPHQEQGVRWMLSQELSNNPPPFWVPAGLNNSRWRCKVSGFKYRSTAPDPIRGGVLADGAYVVLNSSAFALESTHCWAETLHRYGFGKDGSGFGSYLRQSPFGR